MIKKYILFLSFAFIFLPSKDAFSFYVTQESGCSSIDLRTDFPLKMRDQGDVSWCYAHAAADYLQFYNRVSDQISATDIAINYNHRLWPRFLQWLQGGVVPEMGFVRTAIYDILPIGYCPEEYFPSDKWVKRFMAGPQAGQSLSVSLAQGLKEITSLSSGVSAGLYLYPSDLPFVYEFKGVSHQQFYDAIFSDSGTVLDALRSAACDANRKPFPKSISGIHMNIRGRNAFTQINQVLDRHMPLTIDFFYGFLDHIDSYKKTFSELHTTLLMGRKFNPLTQECQYLIKNSYGTDCSEYDHRHECDNGNIWVSEQSLYSAMTSYVYIN